ncbi:SEPP1 protein, partial [Neodrepanis coruscans]|nr:SEPP1 protein [Neodrepanis coruscans]
LLLYIPTRLEDLRVKLENEGLFNISYVVVNHQGAQSRREIHLLEESVSDYITVYQQEEQQEDVWTTLNGNKDDFLIYDRFVIHILQLIKYSALYLMQASVFQEPDIDDLCENITTKAGQKLAEIEPKPTGQHSHHHNLHRHGHHH